MRVVPRGSHLTAFLSPVLLTTLALALSPVHSLVRARESGERIYAIAEPNLFYHDVGELELLVTNVGRFGSGQLGDLPSATWRGNEFLYLGALWIGAIAADGLPYVSTGGYEFELLPSQDEIDTIYSSYEGIEAGVRFGFSGADDDGDGEVDEDFHNGRDDDEDGEVDEDYAAASDQMFSCEYWDYTPESQEMNPEHRPLNLRVRQKSLAWSHPDFDDFVGFEIEVINDGFELLEDVYVGFFLDPDIGPREADGYWTDDGGFVYMGDRGLGQDAVQVCDAQTLPIEMIYMYDVPHLAGGESGDAEGFCGLLLLGHTTDPTGTYFPATEGLHTARFFSGAAPYPEGDPSNDVERYAALASGTVATVPTGDPDDYRLLVSVGPLERLHPGSSASFQFAFVLGEGYYDLATGTPHPQLGTDGTPSGESLLSNAIRLRHFYEGQWRDVDGDPETGIDGRETCLTALAPGEPTLWEDPCGSGETMLVREVECEGPEQYVDNDCSPCTPNPSDPGCRGGGCESLVPWLPLPGKGGLVALAPGLSPTPTVDSARETLSLRVELGTPGTGGLTFQVRSPQPGNAQLQIFDVSGRQVADLGSRSVDVGVTRWAWDGRSQGGDRLYSGVYLARVEVGGVESTARVVIGF